MANQDSGATTGQRGGGGPGHKMARTAWVILARGQAYQKDYVSVKPA